MAAETGVFYGYDRAAMSGAVDQFQLTKSDEAGFSTVKLSLERARFVNRGMSGTDVALLARATMLPSPATEPSTLTLCGVTIVRSFRTAEPAAAGTLQLKIRAPDSGELTPVRLGIVDQSGRSVLPGKDALAIKFYDAEVRQLALSNYNVRSQPWPLENRTVFFSDGSYISALPAGNYRLVASRGTEYRWLQHSFEILPGSTTTLDLTMARWKNLPAQGWYSGDVHIHMGRTREDNTSIMSLLQAEDLHVSNLLLMDNPGGTHFKQYAYGDQGMHRLGQHALVPGIEGPRTAQRGHTISLNIEKPLVDADNYFLYHKFLKAYAEQGAVRGYAHLGSKEFNASWGLALDVPFGLVDFVEILQNSQLRTGFWYEFLNLGYQLAPAAGSDFPYFDQPGAVRSYAQVTAGDPVLGWFDALREGRSFVTNGPVLALSVNGEAMGARLQLDKNPVLKVSAKVEINPDLDQLEALELIVCGELVKRVEVTAGKPYEISLDHELAIENGMWLALNATGKHYAMAHSGPVYIEDDSGSSACREKVPALVPLMQQRLRALETTPIDERRELEYWATGDLALRYRQQLKQLKTRIAQAHKRYEALLLQLSN